MAYHCKACGQEVLWAVDARGKNVALDVRFDCYDILETINMQRLPIASLRRKCRIKHSDVCKQSRTPTYDSVDKGS
jgi:hypothetical protein